MDSSPKPQGRIPLLSRATVALGGSLLVANLVVFGMAWEGLKQGRQQCEEQARTNSRNLAQVLERNLSGEIQAIDLALFAVNQEIRRERQAGTIRSPQLEACIRDVFALNPCLDSLRTANAAGEIDHGIGVPSGPRASVRDRDYFKRLKEDPSAGLVISKPVVGRISQKWVVVLARRIDAPNGHFGGIVYGVIAVDEFTRSLALVDSGPRGSVTVRDGDLGLIARYPHIRGISDRIGDQRVSPLSASMVGSGKTTGTYKARTALDQVERTISFRRVGGHPLYVSVGLAEDDYLAQWRREARKTWGICSILGLSSLVLGALLHRAWHRDKERIQELSLALEEVRTLQDFLPICMYCKKIRDDRNYWSQIEQYITTHTGTRFSHGICPECLPKLMDEIPPKDDLGQRS